MKVLINNFQNINNMNLEFSKIFNNLDKQTFFSNTLYIVPTPIGNISDISLRAIQILSKVDLIAAEDTRYTSILLKNFNIKKKYISFNAYNEPQRNHQLIKLLEKKKYCYSI